MIISEFRHLYLKKTWFSLLSCFISPLQVKTIFVEFCCCFGYPNWQVIATISALSTDQKNFLSSIASLKLHLQNFEGVSRRFERIGTVRGCHIYDDYAHHPTEIQAALQAARQRFPFQELIVIFQPHTYRYIQRVFSFWITLTLIAQCLEFS